jgi:8-oxo-dGTP pyrophosphatase MutT (NUDIX family)
MQMSNLKDNAVIEGYLRHIRTCNNAQLPGIRRPFRIGTTQVGWVRPDLAARLGDFSQITINASGVTLADGAALPAIARQLSDAGCFRWRHEAFDIRAEKDGPVLAQLDRGALPSFGVMAIGVHVNGLVSLPDGPYLWVARRAANKALDPNKLDHIVAGGVPAGLSPVETLVKEAEEEASIPPDLARQSVEIGQISYTMERAEGLRRDLLYCYDLTLPKDFDPHAADGEVEAFELWPINRVMQTVRDSDDFKFNVNLVLIDLFLRQGLIGGSDAAELRQHL